MGSCCLQRLSTDDTSRQIVKVGVAFIKGNWICYGIIELFALCKGGTVTLIFISGRGSAISSAKQKKSGSICNLVKN